MKSLNIADCINETCPWSGEKVSQNALTLYRGKVVGFCNTGCRDKFEKATEQFDDLFASVPK
ncbi:MAG: glutathione S-transferase [Pseudomonadota bacterium]